MINFELKKVEAIGGIKQKDDNNSTQMLNIQVGVVGCPYNDIVANKLIEYTFSNSTSFNEVKSSFSGFASTWVATNYPAVTGATS